MPSYELTAFIAASRERIWTVLADVNHWHQWAPTIESARSIDSRPLELRARFEILQPRLRPAIRTVIWHIPWTVNAVSAPLQAGRDLVCRIFRSANRIDVEFNNVAPILDPEIQQAAIVCRH